MTEDPRVTRAREALADTETTGDGYGDVVVQVLELRLALKDLLHGAQAANRRAEQAEATLRTVRTLMDSHREMDAEELLGLVHDALNGEVTLFGGERP